MSEDCSSVGGDEENRTPDPLLARQVLSHLSYTPVVFPFKGFGVLPGFCLFEVLSSFLFKKKDGPSKLNNILSPKTLADQGHLNTSVLSVLLRKEVIQPHLPIRLPCYDFTLIIDPTFGSALLAVRLLTSGITNSHGVTGGVYKARERIHRGMLIRDY